MERDDQSSAAGKAEYPSLAYELVRENRSLLVNLVDAEKKILALRIDAVQHGLDHIQLTLELQQASMELSKLTIALSDLRQESNRPSIELHRESAAKGSEAGGDVGEPASAAPRD